MATMHVPTFTALSPVEQCQQLEDYLKQLDSSLDFSEVDVLMFSSNLKEVISALSVILDHAKETDAESVLNSIVTLLFELPLNQDDNKNLIISFANSLAEAASDRLAPVALRVVKNLHDGLFECLELQYETYLSMLKLAKKAKKFTEVFTSLAKIKIKYPSKSIGSEKTKNLFNLLNDCAIECGYIEVASQIMIELLATYTEDNASHAEQDAVACIASHIKDPNTFLMDHLLSLKPVLFLEGKPIFDLLTIFVSEKLQDYMNFYEKHRNFVDGLGLDHEQNIKKMRLLTFMQIAEGQRELSYQTIMETLDIERAAIEAFVFEVLRTRLVRAKIDQLNSKVLVQSTMHRTFGRPQWEQLRNILHDWKNNFSHVEKTMRVFLNQNKLH